MLDTQNRFKKGGPELPEGETREPFELAGNGHHVDSGNCKIKVLKGSVTVHERVRDGAMVIADPATEQYKHPVICIVAGPEGCEVVLIRNHPVKKY